MEQYAQSKVVAFGDSVMWGQGIKHKNKFTTLISNNVFKIPFTQADNHAHSGAKIKAVDIRHQDHPANVEIPIYGEIPRGNPSIMRQLERYGVEVPSNAVVSNTAKQKIFPDTELVFLNGGINDINAINLVKGELRTRAQVSRAVTKFCENAFFDLLTAARQKFPNAQLMSIGYHFVLSVASLESLTKTIGLALREDNGVISIYRNGIRSCHYFMALSTAAFQKAVDRFNSIDLEQGHKGAFFVPTLHAESNASFAPRSLSWGIEKVGDAILARLFIAIFRKKFSPLLEVIKLKDEVVEARRAMCNIFTGEDFESNAKCHFASLFHPNSRSARSVAVIAAKTFGKFSGTLSLRAITEGKSITEIQKRLGFKGAITVRQMFATNTIASIELRGVNKKGTPGGFPYHLMELKIVTNTNTFKFKLNHALPFIKGFADGQDHVYPTPPVPITSSRGLVTEGKTQRDAIFNFFAYPSRIIALNEVKEIAVTIPKVKDVARHFVMSMAVRNLKLFINGRDIPLFRGSTTFTALGNAASSTEIMFNT